MRARIIFIILLVLILIFTLWPTVISLGAEWYGRWHGCEVEFTRAIPCIVNGEDQGTYTYSTYAPASSSDAFATLYANTSTAEFDFVDVRVSTN